MRTRLGAVLAGCVTASLCIGIGASASAASFTGLGDLPGGVFESFADGVSGDGSVVVGSGNSASGAEAFRWTSGGGMVGLGDLPGGFFFSRARDHRLRKAGSSVVGAVRDGNGKAVSGPAAGTVPLSWAGGRASVRKGAIRR